MPVRRVGTWKDQARRGVDAALASLFPGGAFLAAILARVDGYLYPHEALFLYHLAREAPGMGSVVEIGSFRGRSTLCLAAGLRRRGEGRVEAVDPHIHGTEAELRENAAHFGLADWVDPVVARSVEAAAAWNRPVRLLFVDGNHLQGSVEADVRAWLPFLRPGGFLLLHDSTELSHFDGPRVVASRLFSRESVFDLTGSIGSISWGRRGGEGEGYRPPECGKRALDALIRIRRDRREGDRSPG